MDRKPGILFCTDTLVESHEVRLDKCPLLKSEHNRYIDATFCRFLHSQE
jgi:hypothetical protein